MNLRVGGRTEWIGALEQVNLSVACLPEDVRGDTTHQEIEPTNILSVVAAMGPFPEYNQSPRNMYQCQMAKQTMGTPYHNHPYRTDNKVYRLLFPQEPIVRTEAHLEYDFGLYPSGTNAVVAVISYTGYDMEDAMILNKSAFERGFGHGSVYKTHVRELNPKDTEGNTKKNPRYRMVNALAEDQGALALPEGLEADGLPVVGAPVEEGSVDLCVYDSVEGRYVNKRVKDSEKGFVESVRLVASEKEDSRGSLDLVYTVRYPRNPVIGDKFSSRHGQKGVLSVLWPQEDMPFTESGITPDVIINPHAFPSRMTIGMLVESLAGKGGALKGEFQTVKTFEGYANDSVVDYFGAQLVERGFNYYGNEVMYSGIYGTPLKVDIFQGVVYYQRLRHMVSDKSQARATGAVDVLTHQPIKGRKKGGGIRFGEMERDSLLSHGAAFCLNDRLLRSSDYAEGFACSKCGSLLGAYAKNEFSLEGGQRIVCTTCKEKARGRKIAYPYVLRYLMNELASMGVKLELKIS